MFVLRLSINYLDRRQITILVRLNALVNVIRISHKGKNNNNNKKKEFIINLKSLLIVINYF